MDRNRYSSFDEKYGNAVRYYGFTQVPNLLIRQLHEFGLNPTDASIFWYIESFDENSFHAVSSIATALGLHPNTIRASIRKLEKMRYLRRIYSRGSANRYDFSGLRSKLRAYTITVDTPAQNLDTPLHRISRKTDQNLYNNKENTKRKYYIDRLQKIKDIRDGKDV